MIVIKSNLIINSSYRYYLNHINFKNKKVITEHKIITVIVHPKILDNSPLTLLPSIFLSLAIFIIITRIGTKIIPLMVAAYNNIWIGLIGLM